MMVLSERLQTEIFFSKQIIQRQAVITNQVTGQASALVTFKA